MSDYEQVEKWPRPRSSSAAYRETLRASVQEFLKNNLIIQALDKNTFSLSHYHALLSTIFHQVYFSSTSFAMAGAMSSLTSPSVRTYLMHHAEEEMNHWQWILEDLQSTGYKGPDPRAQHANWAAQAYLSYGVYLSLFNPVGRLAMAQVLEGISGSFGTAYGMKALQALKITKDQAKFFLLHGELDQGHAQEIDDVLKNENLSPEQWADLEHVARTTARLYKSLYNESVEQCPER